MLGSVIWTVTVGRIGLLVLSRVEVVILVASRVDCVRIWTDPSHVRIHRGLIDSGRKGTSIHISDHITSRLIVNEMLEGESGSVAVIRNKAHADSCRCIPFPCVFTEISVIILMLTIRSKSGEWIWYRINWSQRTRWCGRNRPLMRWWWGRSFVW